VAHLTRERNALFALSTAYRGRILWWKGRDWNYQWRISTRNLPYDWSEKGNYITRSGSRRQMRMKWMIRTSLMNGQKKEIIQLSRGSYWYSKGFQRKAFPKEQWTSVNVCFQIVRRLESDLRGHVRSNQSFRSIISIWFVRHMWFSYCYMSINTNALWLQKLIDYVSFV
jgi:hypothetical protein